MKWLVSTLILLLGVAPCCPRATGLGDQGIVVYNSRMPLSKGVAEYYTQERKVPKSQVFGFDLSTSEEMSRAEFRDELQKPLAKALSGKKLWRMGSHARAPSDGQRAGVDWAVVDSKIR